jgi:hypothetical protein
MQDLRLSPSRLTNQPVGLRHWQLAPFIWYSKWHYFSLFLWLHCRPHEKGRGTVSTCLKWPPRRKVHNSDAYTHKNECMLKCLQMHEAVITFYTRQIAVSGDKQNKVRVSTKLDLPKRAVLFVQHTTCNYPTLLKIDLSLGSETRRQVNSGWCCGFQSMVRGTTGLSIRLAKFLFSLHLEETS